MKKRFTPARALAPLLLFLPAMSLSAESIAPRALAWANATAAHVLATGAPLDARSLALARKVGVRNPGAIRALVVDSIALPAELHAAGASVGLPASGADGLTLGHAGLVRRPYAEDPVLLSHEFRHVAQYEAVGGIAPFLARHLRDLFAHGYADSPFERDARAHEQAAFQGE